MSTLRSRSVQYILHKMRVGLARKCPDCELGDLFEQRFSLRETCAYCDARFSRHSGDGIGGTYINIVVVEVSALAGFILVDHLTNIPIMHQLIFWIPYTIVALIWFYPHARGLWTAVLFLTGAIYPDPDYEREYIAPYHTQYPSRPRESPPEASSNDD